MQRLITPFIIVGLLSASACSSWPPKGQGGMAEHHKQDINPAIFDQPLDPERPLHLEFELAERHLDVLILEGAKLCFPATVVQAALRQQRIARELVGGLHFDAANDLIIQRKVLAQLERQLDAVREQQSCIPSIELATSSPVASETPSSQTTGVDFRQQILLLLNSDNQFAFDSAELNPKYQSRLTEAAQLLQHASPLQLIITGHSDILGDEQYNQSLSLARAHKVGSYLQSYGVDAARIQYHAQGASHPLFSGEAPHIRLTNRRVTIVLANNHASGE